MDFGYVTHAVHADSRYVELLSSLSDSTVTATGPPNGYIYPPGPGWLLVVVDGVPSKAVKVMVGSGQSPEVNQKAIDKYVSSTLCTRHLIFTVTRSILSQTSADEYDDLKKEHKFEDDAE